jgi:molybdate transport system substrate-binding protein
VNFPLLRFLMFVHVARSPKPFAYLIFISDFSCLSGAARRGTTLGLDRTRLLDTNLALLLFILLLTSGLAGCSGGSGGENGGGSKAESSTLTVFAASSLTDAFGKLESTFEEQNPGTDVRMSFAASSDLLFQIQQAAPADVFASADEAKMDTAVEEGLVKQPELFARNTLVVIVPAANPAGIVEFGDLPGADAKVVLAVEGVPIAEYAEQVLANADASYGEGFSQSVLDKLVSREPNVRAAAQKVTLGEADATFVYRSDVTEDIRDQVQIVEVPEDLNVVATYPIAAVERSENPDFGQEWIDFVLSDEGQGVLEKYDFMPA